VSNDKIFKGTHLQFGDNTLIIKRKSWSNIHTIKATFLLFEPLSILKVNFHKILLVVVNVDRSCLNEATLMFNCKVEVLPCEILRTANW
jgi:hypothetical protein